MIKPFKLLHGYTYSDEYTLPILTDVEPPFNISRRHWNMMPQDLRGGTQRHMEVYIEGWEAFRNNITISPYAGIWNPEFNELNHLWNRGYIVSSNRRRRLYTERDMEYYHTEDFLFFDVSEERYGMVDGSPYKVMLYRSIEEGNTVEGQTIYPDHYMYNFPDVI
jgi:hypothetical protein